MTASMGEAAAVQSAFIDRLERDGFGNPFVIARAPGRVNLIGDHVDYCGGLVMPIAIEASCLCAVIPGRAGSGRVAISSELTGETIAVEIGKPLVPGQDAPIGAWPSYIIGVLAGLQGVGSLEALDGCELRVTSAVPLGAGLSSSAALEVSVATAAAQVAGIMLDEKQRARLCQRAEHEFAGVPCGLMDQMVSSAAQRGNALLLDCQSEEIQHVPFPAAPRLLVVNSGVSHSLADGQYAARRASCQAAADKLGIEHLAHAAMADVEKLDAELIPYARHVVSETARVSAAAEAFSSDQLRHAGELMSASHASLRDDFRVSCDEVDVLVARLIESDAVLGARMTGGGFGGSVVALVTDGGEDEAISCADSCRDTCPDLAHFFASPCGGAELVYDQQA